MTPLALLLGLSGLSLRDAAATLRISTSMIDKMSRGQRATPPSLLAEMRALIERQEREAREAVATIREMEAPEVEIGYPADDYEAQALGWPCVSAWRAMTARVVAAVDTPIILSPRGSTVGTACAADEREQ